MQLRRSSLAAGALALALTFISTASMAFVTVGLSINIAPPVLPVYEQPAIPAPGYLWVPGYWAWGDDGYYWVPGTWVLPPQEGLLWTPGYWGWADGVYVWNPGYWGPEVGFYGGVNYGYGYTGVGYAGGYWDHGAFYYNRAVNNVSDVHITNVYNKTVINNVTVNRVSYNGGSGGIQARPTPEQVAAARGPHVQPVAAQQQHEQMAARDPQLRASVNHGRPAIAATQRPGAFSGHVMAARNAPTTHMMPPEQSSQSREHSNGQPAHAPGGPPSHGPTGMGPEMNHSGPPAAHPAPQNEFRSIPERHSGPAPAPHEVRPPQAHESAPREAQPQAHESAPREAAPHEQQRRPNERR